MKKSQRLDANYAVTMDNRIKSKSPYPRKESRSLSPSHRVKNHYQHHSSYDVIGNNVDNVGTNNEETLSDRADSSSNEGSYFSSSNPRSKIVTPIGKRIEVTSANIKRWIHENNLKMLEGVVLEGHGDRLKSKSEQTDEHLNDTSDTNTVDNGITESESDAGIFADIYIRESVPKIMNKIRVIHAAVSVGDLNGLVDNLDKKDYVLAKDHFGMAPLHKATIMGHLDVVQYILEKFPEVVNAKDKEDRTALHYAAATTNRNGTKIYKMLMRAGADPRMRDSSGKTSEYYRVHRLSLPGELSRRNSRRKLNPINLDDSESGKKRPLVLPAIQEKLSNALHDGDAKQLHALVLEGYGHALFGRTSYAEEARKFLKNLPHLMDNIRTLHTSISNGDVGNVDRILSNDSSLIRAKSEKGLYPIHLAAAHNQVGIVLKMIEKFPYLIQLKDNTGKTVLHIAGMNKSHQMYKLLVDSGGDPKIMDHKGRTADYYMGAPSILSNYEHNHLVPNLEMRKTMSEENLAPVRDGEFSKSHNTRARNRSIQRHVNKGSEAHRRESSVNKILPTVTNSVISDGDESINPKSSTITSEETTMTTTSQASSANQSSSSRKSMSQRLPSLMDDNPLPTAEEILPTTSSSSASNISNSNVLPVIGNTSRSNSKTRVKRKGGNSTSSTIVMKNEMGKQISKRDNYNKGKTSEEKKISNKKNEKKSGSSIKPTIEAKNDASEVEIGRQEIGEETSEVNEADVEENVKANVKANVEANVEAKVEATEKKGNKLSEEENNDKEEQGDVNHVNQTNQAKQTQEKSKADNMEGQTIGRERVNASKPETNIKKTQKQPSKRSNSSTKNVEPKKGKERIKKLERQSTVKKSQKSESVKTQQQQQQQQQLEGKTEEEKDKNSKHNKDDDKVNEGKDDVEVKDAKTMPIVVEAGEMAERVIMESLQTIINGEESEQNDNNQANDDQLKISGEKNADEAEGKLNDGIVLSGEEAEAKSKEVENDEETGEKEEKNIGSNDVEEKKVFEGEEEEEKNEEEKKEMKMDSIKESESVITELNEQVRKNSIEKGDDKDDNQPSVIQVEQQQRTEDINEKNGHEDDESERRDSKQNSEVISDGKDISDGKVIDDGKVISDGKDDDKDDGKGIDDAQNCDDFGNNSVEQVKAENKEQEVKEGEAEENKSKEKDGIVISSVNTQEDVEATAEANDGDVKKGEGGENENENVIQTGKEEEEDEEGKTSDSINQSQTQYESKHVTEEDGKRGDMNEDTTVIDTASDQIKSEIRSEKEVNEKSDENEEKSENEQKGESIIGTESGSGSGSELINGATETYLDEKARLESTQLQETIIGDINNKQTEVDNELTANNEDGINNNEQMDVRQNINGISVNENETAKEENETAKENEAAKEENGNENENENKNGEKKEEEIDSSVKESLETGMNNGLEHSNFDTQGDEEAHHIVNEEERETNIDSSNRNESQEKVNSNGINNTIGDEHNNGSEKSIHENDINEEIEREKEQQRRSVTTSDDEGRPRSNESGMMSDHNNDDKLGELIVHWIEEPDLLRLEHVIIAGQGERLIGRKSHHKKVQEFLDLVPAYISKIQSVHDVIIRGNINEVKQVLTRKRFALSRDHLGASPLHLAVLHQHMDVMLFIIAQFPETIDGPDNEGRTPLHYASVMNDPQKQYYEILRTAGANTQIRDKNGRTPEFYLENKNHDLSTRSLLEKYRRDSLEEESGKSVDVWHRPPTADIESRLTPTPDEDYDDTPRASPKRCIVDAVVHVDADFESRTHSRLSKTHSSAFNRSISQGSLVSRKSIDDREFDEISNDFQMSLKHERIRLQRSYENQMSSRDGNGLKMAISVSEASNEDIQKQGAMVNGNCYYSYNLIEVKDERGQTVLHLAAEKPHKNSLFERMLSQAEYLIPERDAQYRTIRDVAVQSGMKENVHVIDQYVIQAFVKQNVTFVKHLSQEGFDILLSVVDTDGHDVIEMLKRQCHDVDYMMAIVQDIAQFQKNREELHTFIRHGYHEGIIKLVDKDPFLVTAKNTKGRCALHTAVLMGNLDIIETLIAANRRAINTPDNLGRTSLHYSMASSRVEEIGRILIQAGAIRTIRDVKMRTPSYYFVYKEEIRDLKIEEQHLI